jgi:hypothetical protein
MRDGLGRRNVCCIRTSVGHGMHARTLHPPCPGIIQRVAFLLEADLRRIPFKSLELFHPGHGRFTRLGVVPAAHVVDVDPVRRGYGPRIERIDVVRFHLPASRSMFSCNNLYPEEEGEHR